MENVHSFTIINTFIIVFIIIIISSSSSSSSSSSCRVFWFALLNF